MIRRECITRGIVDRHGPSDECPRCETGQGSHSEECRSRFDKERPQETELRQAEIPLTPTTTTTAASATTPASTPVLVTITINPALDAQTLATGVSVHAASAQSGGNNCWIEESVGDLDTDVPMLAIDQQPTVGGRRVCTDGSRLDSELPTCVLCPTSEELEEYDDQEEDARNEQDWHWDL